MKLKRTTFAAVILTSFFFFCVLTAELFIHTCPFPELRTYINRKYSTVITDRNGEILRILPLEQGLRREYVPLSALPAEVLPMLLETEDKRFFSHRGVDGFAILRSMVINWKAGHIVSGASTLSMQLAGLVKPRPKTFSGKLYEAWDALRIEAKFSKREILELWINSVPFGNQAEGMGMGSREYFNKPVSDLSVPELAVLIVIPRHPAKYNPLTNPAETYREAVENSRRLSVPVEEEEIRSAVTGAQPGNYVFHAPHFIKRIEELNPIKGKGRAATIRTTLDLDVQLFFRERLNLYIRKYEQSRVTSGAGILLDNHTGEVLAYIGSTDFFSGREGAQIDGVTVPRQPGSCLKPFLYAAALEEGWLPNTLLPDVPLDFGGKEVYVPRNFTNTYSGPVRFRVALGSSLNVPAVYLLQEIGLDTFVSVLQKAGFTLTEKDIYHAGLGAALGNLEVDLLDLTKGFALFPRRGVPLQSIWLLPNSRADQSLLKETGETVISRFTADLICDILADPAARAEGFGYNTAFTTPFPAMFKTGTSDQFQNIWALAATPDYTVGVWMGNNTGETVIGRTGSSVPVRIASELLSFVQRGSPRFPEPEGAVKVKICAVSGEKATDLCPSRCTEYFPPDFEEGDEIPFCTFHVKKNGRVVTEYPERYYTWVRELGRTGGYRLSGNRQLTILHPQDGAVYYFDPTVPAENQEIRIEAFAGIQGPFVLSINGETFGKIENPPYVWYFPLTEGIWHCTVAGAGLEDEVTIEVR